MLLASPEDDPEGPIHPRVVEEVFVRASPLLALRVCGREIRTTNEHPFYVQGKGWVKAWLLSPGDLLRTADGRWLPVESIADTGDVATVYNFRVAEYHTYYVGSPHWGFAVWSHNSNCARGAGVSGNKAPTHAPINRHHPIPKFLGGYVAQVLSRLDATIHTEFHSLLGTTLKMAGIPLNVGGRGGSAADWSAFMKANPGTQRIAFDALLTASRAIDAKYGTSITQGVWHNIIKGNFRPHP